MRFAAPKGILPVSKLVNSAISVAGPATGAFAGPPAPDETYQPEILSTMTGWLTHSLTDHPKGKGKGKGGEGFVQFKWFKEFLIRKCKKEWCSCCAAKTLMDEDGACELCVRAWRLTMVCTYWRDAVVANGGTAWSAPNVRWTKEERKAKFAYRLWAYGNHRSTSWNYYKRGVQPEDAQVLAIADDRLQGYQPQVQHGVPASDDQNEWWNSNGTTKEDWYTGGW